MDARDAMDAMQALEEKLKRIEGSIEHQRATLSSLQGMEGIQEVDLTTIKTDIKLLENEKKILESRIALKRTEDSIEHQRATLSSLQEMEGIQEVELTPIKNDIKKLEKKRQRLIQAMPEAVAKKSSKAAAVSATASAAASAAAKESSKAARKERKAAEKAARKERKAAEKAARKAERKGARKAAKSKSRKVDTTSAAQAIHNLIGCGFREQNEATLEFITKQIKRVFLEGPHAVKQLEQELDRTIAQGGHDEYIYKNLRNIKSHLFLR